MKKVLLVDTNLASLPIYRALKALNYDVHVIGKNPADCLAKIEKNFWQVDYSQVDKLAEFIKKQKFDFIIPGCNDRSYSVCSIIGGGEWPALETPEVDQIINNKSKFRQFSINNELNVPRTQILSQQELIWPLIVKPVDTYSGIGISTILNKDMKALENAIDYARKCSPTGQYIIENYIRGQLYSHTAFLKDKKIDIDFIVLEDSTVNPYAVDTSRVVFEPNERMLLQIRNAINFIALKLDLKDGLIHTQYINDGLDNWIIEITRRCPGDLYSLLIELSTGFPYAENYTRAFLGLPFLYNNDNYKPDYIIRHTLTLPKCQPYLDLAFNRELLIKKWFPLKTIGDQLQEGPLGRMSIAFFRANSQLHSDELYHSILQRQLYTVGN